MMEITLNAAAFAHAQWQAEHKGVFDAPLSLGLATLVTERIEPWSPSRRPTLTGVNPEGAEVALVMGLPDEAMPIEAAQAAEARRVSNGTSWRKRLEDAPVDWETYRGHPVAVRYDLEGRRWAVLHHAKGEFLLARDVALDQSVEQLCLFTEEGVAA